jgi:ABC-type multidrug transport system fused ATPase/permease subunit
MNGPKKQPAGDDNGWRWLCTVFQPFIRYQQETRDSMGQRVVNYGRQAVRFNRAGVGDFVFHVGTIGVLVTFIFFFYATLIEGAIVQKQTSNVVQKLFRDIKAVATPEQQADLQTFANNFQTTSDPANDEKICTANQASRNLALEIFLPLLAGSVGFTVLFCWWDLKSTGTFTGANLRDLVKRVAYVNVTLFICIGISEYVFLTLFARNFITLDPNFVKRTVLGGVIKQLPG